MTPRPKVILVDDDDTVLRLMARRLSPFYDVVPTGNPHEVRGLLRKARPHALLCDVDMPGLSGGELAAEIAADPAISMIPVVFMTDLATPDEVDELGGQIGGRPAISKGADTIEVVRVIERVCVYRNNSTARA